MFGNPVTWSVSSAARPAVGERGRASAAGARACAARPRCSARCRSRASPRRSRRRAPGQIKALVTIAGNPVISAPDAARLDDALPMLECMISVDNYLNETTRHAHVILPGLSPLEQPHFDELIWGWAVRNGGQVLAADLPAATTGPHEWEILHPARRLLRPA